MAAVTLATARAAVATALAGITTANIYRRRHTSYEYPCLVVGWPEEFDVRPTHGEARDITLNVWVAVESIDDESADDLLSGFLESTVAALLTNPAWDVLPSTEFNEALLDDQRVEISCRVPVRLLT
jgi:hypothetical protein